MDRYQEDFAAAFHLAIMPARFAVERRAWGEAATLDLEAHPYLAWDRLAWPLRVLPQGRPHAASEPPSGSVGPTTMTTLPRACPSAGASVVEAGEADGACRLVVTSGAAPGEVRAFVERAVLTNRLFLTANRAEGELVRIGARGAAFTAEALLEPGPPTRLTWTLQPAGQP